MKRSCFLDSLPFPIVFVSSSGIIEACNLLFAKLIEGAFSGVAIESLFARWEAHDDRFVTAVAGDRSFLLFAGEPEHGAQDHLAYIVVDGSFVQRMQRKIIDLEQELNAVMEISNDVIYITDREGVTLKTNSAIQRFTGYPKQCYINQNVQDLVERGLMKTSITLKVLEQKKPVNYIYTSSYLTDKKRFAMGMPIVNEAGEIEKVITNVRDLTELNQFYNELKRALELNHQYRKELEKLKAKRIDPDVIVNSRSMLEIYDIADRIADVDATVLILGETGAGKDVLARHIYRVSSRSEQGEFIKINCGAIPHDLLESELFGYEAGAFTGASRTGKPGLFELAHQGVLFLDEVGELPLSLQVKLLRVLQEKQIQRIGATKPKDIDVRLIAATNRDLKHLVKQGAFREDLYYRLNVIPLYIPPLRERKEDILPLVRSVVHRLNRQYNTDKKLDQDVESFFYQYAWPGNVRELTNLIERLILTVPTDEIGLADLPPEYREQDVPESGPACSHNKVMTLKEAAEIAEREILAIAMQKYNSTYKMAEQLGTSQATIVRKLKKYNL
ncbi:sigma-54 interaction domain-containing protein [Brevibacillus massiliensis]|jgi:PAS domain S-box-containing protein/TyrR family helix-turn-helix protein|uniref:sigma-54 interaction domain-containing protein n=1 Tax=Brevibacillus massiliensis TaxID=1118054 RepID=UPI0002FB729F|nr:sigma 54-interacting transcriptional regulator [Brevibacillus massiliensis]